MNRPVTVQLDGHLQITARPERIAEIRKAMAAIKTPSVRAFRSAQMRKADKRYYPKHTPGITTEQYVEAYWKLNGGAVGLVCNVSLCTGKRTPMEGEVQRLVGYFYEPLGTTPQHYPLFDGVEEAL
ncbi:MAG: hypothetical protein CGW95_06550 [Phenylobacterium zucineum]|nr:MAG: hypothetical protein CGW95_06550 [Phenylobacterium zucineum]